MPLNRIAGFCPSGANRIPSLAGVWRWPDQSCPPASVHIVANQSRTATTGGDHADPVHRRDFLPPFQVMGSLDCTCEDEHTWLWHCRVTNSQCRNHPAGTFLSKCPEMCAEGLSIPGSRFGSCWESNFSS